MPACEVARKLTLPTDARGKADSARLVHKRAKDIGWDFTIASVTSSHGASARKDQDGLSNTRCARRPPL